MNVMKQDNKIREHRYIPESSNLPLPPQPGESPQTISFSLQLFQSAENFSKSCSLYHQILKKSISNIYIYIYI